MADVVAADRLRAIVRNIENVNEQIAALQEDRKQLYAGAKAEGFDPPTLRRLIAKRAKDQQIVQEQEELLALYEAAVNGQMPLPLEEVA